MRNCIFSYYNLQIHPNIITCQSQVIHKLLQNLKVEYIPLQYNAKDGELYPDDCINYALNELFYNRGYDSVLILDIDCIPLSTSAIKYTFERINQGYLMGNVQRSHYIENNEHLFIGSSCLGITKGIYEQLGKPDAKPTSRGDIGEEFTYLAEEKNIPIEMYLPDNFEAKPYGVDSWALKENMKHYGIGTTFNNVMDNPMFYHLFESRTNLNVERFVKKSISILYE